MDDEALGYKDTPCSELARLIEWAPAQFQNHVRVGDSEDIGGAHKYGFVAEAVPSGCLRRVSCDFRPNAEFILRNFAPVYHCGGTLQ